MKDDHQDLTSAGIVDYKHANGLEELEHILNDILDKKTNADNPYVDILLHIKDQQSWIKIVKPLNDQDSYKFYYSDFFSRPAMRPTKEIIAKCMQNKLGTFNEAKQFFDVHTILLANKVENSIRPKAQPFMRNTLEFAYNQLNFAINTNAWNKVQASKMGFFAAPSKPAINTSENVANPLSSENKTELKGN